MVKATKKGGAKQNKNTRKVVVKKVTTKKASPKAAGKKAPKKAVEQEATKRFLVAGNWKMNPETISEARSLFNGIKERSRTLKATHLVICPPAIYFDTLKNLYSGKKISFGAQTAFTENTGAFTGEISPTMIKSAGGEYVILGHSERRAMGETDEDVRARIDKALAADLTPIVCIGEHSRDEDGRYLSVIKEQLKALFNGMSRDWLRRVVIAYEPIWAIGKTGKDAVSGHALHETAIYIRKVLSEMFDKTIAIEQRILYGGSVKTENAAGLIDGTQVDGFLVGGASLEADEFMKIAETVENYAKR